MQALRPTVAAIAMQHNGSGWQALVKRQRRRETYELVLAVAKARGRWLVSHVGFRR
jgi:hypothetical protein